MSENPAQAAFKGWSAEYNHQSDEWLDMDPSQFFEAGYATALREVEGRTDGRLPPSEGRAGGPDGPEPCGLGADARSSLTQPSPMVQRAMDRFRSKFAEVHAPPGITVTNDGEWVILHVKAGGAETTTSLTKQQASVLRQMLEAQPRVSDGSPAGRDAKQLDGEATTARSDAVGDAPPSSRPALRSPEEE